MVSKTYSAGAVKHAFWFMEFRKVVSLREDGKPWDEIKRLVEEENLFGTSTPARAKQIWNTVSGRIASLGENFYPIFQTCDISSQKLFALVAAMACDRLFAEFVYEVVREKLIIGSNELTEADIRIFFRNKQEQDDIVAKWTDATVKRLGATYKSLLYEAGVTDKGKDVRKIYKPLPDPMMERWLKERGMEYYVKALTGVR